MDWCNTKINGSELDPHKQYREMVCICMYIKHSFNCLLMLATTIVIIKFGYTKVFLMYVLTNVELVTQKMLKLIHTKSNHFVIVN